MRIAEQFKPVFLLEPEDHNAGVDGDSFDMANYDHAALFVTLGDLTGDAKLTINSGASAGTKTTAETFNYRLTSADLKNANGDKLGSETTTTTLTLTATGYNDRMVVVEIDASELTDGQNWVTPTFSADASKLFAQVTAVLGKPRYAENVPPTAIA